MAFASVYSAQTIGLRTHIVRVEADLSRGLHSFVVVGLPDKAVEESRDRVGSAIKNCGLKSPKHSNQKVVISLSPADIKKEGPLFDLAIALAYLSASGDVLFNPEKKLFLGELSLDGKLRPIKGALPVAQKAREAGFTEIYLPCENAREAALVEGIAIYGAETLKDVINHLDTRRQSFVSLVPTEPVVFEKTTVAVEHDLADIRGQETAKRALEIAAAGRHNIALYGPPGTGKTMLAKAFAALLPPLSFDDALSVTSIHSVAGILDKPYISRAPLRSPHHTSSHVSIVGGGAIPRPGEATLAHHGVLFLDEFPEFDRRVIEALRQPLEDKVISISRSKGTEIFPANFILIAAMNPCPCGNHGTDRPCVCSPGARERYQRKISGPIVDRIDIWVHVPRIAFEKLAGESKGERSVDVQKRIGLARALQHARFMGKNTNGEMSAKEIEKSATLDTDTRKILNASAERLGLSPRAYHKVIKVARTIADLENMSDIKREHILEALQYRPREVI